MWLVDYLILSVHNMKEQKSQDDQFPAGSQISWSFLFITQLEGDHTSEGGVWIIFFNTLDYADFVRMSRKVGTLLCMKNLWFEEVMAKSLLQPELN